MQPNRCQRIRNGSVAAAVVSKVKSKPQHSTALAKELQRLCRAAGIATDPAAAAKLRRRCQTDLRFLGEQVLGIPFYEPVHGEFVNLFVQKNPDKGIYEQDSVRQRLLLSPRNTMKTTWDQVDILQWVLCFPDIRILILTGTQDLGTRMVQQIKLYLQTHPVIRTLFNLCPVDSESRWGNVDEFTVTRSKDWREPTLCMSTIASVKASSHYDVFKLDDIANEINSATPDQRAKVKAAVEDTYYLQEPQGSYFDFIGTRYDIDDYYGHLLRANEQAEKESEEPPTKAVILAAWAVKAGRELAQSEDCAAAIITKDDVDLLYPERLLFKELSKQYRKNPYKFSCQMLNAPNPTLESTLQSFDEALIQRHTIPYDQLPFSGRTFACWDLAGYSKAVNTDFTVGVIGRLSDDNKLYIIEVIRGRYNQYQQAGAIVEAARSWRPEVTIIEDSQGSKALEPTIVRVAQDVRVTCPITWYTPPRRKDAKNFRIGHLASILRSDRLWFAAHLRELSQLKDELVNFPFGRHDDISDAIGILASYLPMLSEDAPPVAAEHDTAQRRMREIRERVWDKMVFPDTPAGPDEPITSPDNYDDLLGSSLMCRPQ